MMDTRQKFLACMSFEPGTPIPKWEYGYWAGVIRRWYTEGLQPVVKIPADMDGGLPIRAEMMGYKPGGVVDQDVNRLLGLDEPERRIPIINFIYPLFEKKILEDHGEWFIYQDVWGITKQEKKDRSAPERFLSAPVKTWDDWERLKAERLQPDTPGRLPKNLPELVKFYRQRTYPLVIGGEQGFYGSARYLLGDVDVLTTFYDQPKLVHAINSHLCDFWIALYDPVLQLVTPDAALIWEDVCYKNGPLISPKMFQEFCLPYYKKLTGFFRDHHVDIIHVDTDGDCWKLIPLFLEGGVTGLFPMEVAANMDIAKVRQAFPRLQIIGGVDKMRLSKSFQEIDLELDQKIIPTLPKGGFIPMVDHLVPPDVPWDNFVYYRQKLNHAIDDLV